MLLKRSTLPVTKLAGKDSIGVRDNGQIVLSASCSKALEGRSLIIPDWDDVKRMLTLFAHHQPPKGWTKEEMFQATAGKKTHNLVFGAAGLLQHAGYDYKGSGNQTYDAMINREKSSVTITLPKKATPKPPGPSRRKRGTGRSTTAPQAPVGQAGADGRASGKAAQEEEVLELAV